jgi:hypothetical protein
MLKFYGSEKTRMPEVRLYKSLYDNIACYLLRLHSGMSVSVRVLVFSLLTFMLEWKIKFSVGKTGDVYGVKSQ